MSRALEVATVAVTPWRAARRIREQEESLTCLIRALDVIVDGETPADRKRPALTLIRGGLYCR